MFGEGSGFTFPEKGFTVGKIGYYISGLEVSYVETPNDNHDRGGLEVSWRNRDLRAQVLGKHVNVIPVENMGLV